MPDDEKPNPVDDLKKGLGLLFRAAKTAVDKLPTGKLEDVVMSGAREVGRAVENVADTIDKELFHKKDKPQAAPEATAKSEEPRKEDHDRAPHAEKETDKEPANKPQGGPRVE